MEYFMNKTGFYSKVTMIEAERRSEERAKIDEAIKLVTEKENTIKSTRQ